MSTLEAENVELPPPEPLHDARPAAHLWPAALWRPETGFFLSIWLGLLIAGRERLFQDPGTFWHTVVGRHMLDAGTLARRDAFTFTYAERPWIAHQWLGECLMALVQGLGGWDALLLTTVTLLAAFYTCVAQRLLRSGFASIGVALLLVVVLATSSHHFHIRPHLATLVLTGVSFGLLCDVEAGRRRLPHLCWLPPLLVLWANLHGGALGGLATMTFTFAGWILARRCGATSPLKTAADARLLAGVWLASCAALFVNPYGLEIPGTWLAILRLSLPDIIREHGRLDFAQVEAWMVVALGLGYLAALWGVVAGCNRGLTPTLRLWRVTWLVPLLWLVLACDRVRHAPLFAIVAIIALADLLPRTRWWDYLLKNEWCFPRPRQAGDVSPLFRRCLGLIVPVSAVLSAVALQAISKPAPVFGSAWARFDPAVWPVALVPELQSIERSSSASDRRIFNSLEFGGFVTFHAPGLRTFIDDRCELFGDEFLRAYSEAENCRPEQLDVWQQQYDFRHALVRSGSPFDAYLQGHADWQLIGRDPAAALYRRRGR